MLLGNSIFQSKNEFIQKLVYFHINKSLRTISMIGNSVVIWNLEIRDAILSFGIGSKQEVKTVKNARKKVMKAETAR
jgi:hypothetical protein